MTVGTQHSAGGKSFRRLHPGVQGYAEISPCTYYRPWLARLRTGGPLFGAQGPIDTLDALERAYSALAGKSILYIGLNPSVADPLLDDPTVSKEQAIAFARGFDHYLKANIFDYRSTDPKKLPDSLSVARSPANLAAISRLSALADTVILCCGVPPKKLRAGYDDVLSVLRTAGVSPYAISVTKDGYPGHPLYVSSSTPFSPFPI